MNSAQRLQNIFDHFNFPAGTAQTEGWTRWLKAKGFEPTDDNILIAVRATTREIRSLQASLTNIGVPESLHKDLCTRLLHAFQSNHLHQAWGNVSAAVVSGDAKTAMKWMSWALSKLDEPDIDAESYKALQQAISEQEQLLNSTDLPPNIKELLTGQIEEMKVALMLYQVNGIKPVVDAVNRQFGEMRNASQGFVQEMEDAGPEARKAVSGGLSVLSKAIKFAESGSKLYKFGKDLHELAANGWPLLEKMLPPGSGS